MKCKLGKTIMSYQPPRKLLRTTSGKICPTTLGSTTTETSTMESEKEVTLADLSRDLGHIKEILGDLLEALEQCEMSEAEDTWE